MQGGGGACQDHVEEAEEAGSRNREVFLFFTTVGMSSGGGEREGRFSAEGGMMVRTAL